MKTIIAPTDFSIVSLNAVNYAADLAAATGNKLLLVHTVQLPVVYGEVPVAADTIDQLVADAEKHMELLREQLRLRVRAMVEIQTEVSARGGVVAQLEEYCRAINPVFVVMGSQGSTGIERLLFGSNTIGALKDLTSPVIVVPAGAAFGTIKKIGFACDLKKVATTAPVAELKAMVREFNAQLHIIHVNADDDITYPPELISESEVAHELFEELNPVYHFLNNTDVDEALNDYAVKSQLDLLVVVPRRHDIFEKLVHRSHAKNLVLHTHIPVLSIHE
jgi:nucleotide-binding universal stress UspA family protein